MRLVYRAVVPQDSPPINYKWLHSQEVGQHTGSLALESNP